MQIGIIYPFTVNRRVNCLWHLVLFFVGLLILLHGTVTSGVRQRQTRPVLASAAVMAGAPAPPQGSGYAYLRTITIDHTKVPNTDQSNFPLLISGTYSYLATVSNGGNVQNANGYDVIFTSDPGCVTRLDHEVETYSATTGAVNYWVRVPLLSHSNDTTIYICYGNAAIVTDQSNKTGVWNSNFKAVYHLGDQAANTTVTDSTANGSNGINSANTSNKSVSGKFGRALTYNGSSDNTATGVPQTSSFTWECWFKLTDWTTQPGSSNYSTLMAANYPAGGALLMLWKDPAFLVQFAPDNVGGVTSGANSIAPGVWHHAAYTRTGNNGTYALYFDGEWKGQVASGTTNTTSTITLGTRADYMPQALNGLLDETRISNVARSAEWIKAQYNNQSSPATFYSISASSNCCDTSTARLDPLNATGGAGENPLSRNFNWTLPFVSLPGRAGMDLSLSLSYNSLVWTRSGNYISFDDDRGFPSPGFRLGFPVIQPLYYNAEVGKYAFLLMGNDGSRTELRRVGSSVLYEAADSSHLLLDANTMVLRTTDGSQLKYELKGSEYQCTEIKDRNGNYITVNYTPADRIDTIVDTLARSIKFNYDANGWLLSITQVWNQGTPNQVTHNWATFGYSNTTIQTNFTGLTVSGPSNNSGIKTLSKVTLADGSHYDFSYTSWGQVWKVSSFAADNHLLNYRAYNLPGSPLQATGPQSDCPRFTERRDWVEHWNRNVSGVEQEAITFYGQPAPASWTMPDGAPQSGTRAEVTTPDGTVNKIYFIGTAGTASGWRRGLPALVETYSGGNWQRKVMTTWTQDNTSVSYLSNPRVTETNVYDPAGNRARVGFTYQQVTFANGTSCQLPRDVYEYAANASTILRSTRTDYHPSTVYTDRRIIGLVTEKRLFEGDVNSGGVLRSKVGFFYDNENGASSIQGNDAPVQHDNTNYTASFVTGRANLSSTRRYDVTNTAQFTTKRSKYNTAGAVVSTTDASNHTAQISYTDSFSDGVSRNTRAYPTTFTDPDNYTATTKYNFDFGAVTYRRTPQPNTTQNLPGPEQTLTYDTIGRPQQVTNQVNGAYTRFVYANTMTRVDTYATVQDGLGEAHSFKSTDGAGRVIGTATQHPGSIGGYSGQRFVYDVMGRVIKTSNPTETNASGSPLQWVAAGDDAAAGWIYREQTYDWKGRPLVATNQDGTTKTASYSGCGCAGGEVVTLTDEGTIDGGVAKRRQQKIYSDVLGRTVKTEVLNWQGGSVYSATVNTYNARDQITQIRQYAGAEGSGTYQDTTMSYDGYGRPGSRHVPEQDVGTATVWTYNADDTVNTVTDARGAITTLSYAGNNRKLVTSVSHALSGQSNVTASFSYDALGNRTVMTDSLGITSYSYDQLSRLISETRGFTGVGNFTISYQYNLARDLISITGPASTTINYTRDSTGRLTAISRPGQTLASAISYRASGAMKHMLYGDNSTMNVTFNSRLLPATYNLSGKISKTYSYHDDGALRFSSDGIDHRFDRSYGFDHVGRMKSAFSGAEARGEGTTTNRPYYQTYGYDAFGHMSQRTMKTWSTGEATMSVSFVNNRQLGINWQYDADGRLVHGDDYRSYDAAGRNNYLEVSGPTLPTAEITYDGDGRQIKTIETWLDENLERLSETKYYLRSTVMGGQLLAEVDPWGQLYRTFVYAGPAVFGWLWHPESSASMVWRQRDPSGATVRGSGEQELDPLGADHGTFAASVIPTEQALVSYYGSYNPAHPNFTYSVDGVRQPLAEISFAGAFGTTIGYPDEPFWPADWDPDFVEWLIRKGRELTTDNFSELQVEWLMEYRQKTLVGSDELEAYRERIEKMLKNKNCADYIQKLLNEVKTQTGRSFGDILTTFDAIRFYWANTDGAHGGYAYLEELGTVRAADIMNTINTERMGGSRANQMDRRAFLISETTQAFLGETMHHLSQDGRMYSDPDMANALNAILVRQELDTYRNFPDKTPADIENASRYWHRKVASACPAPRR